MSLYLESQIFNQNDGIQCPVDRCKKIIHPNDINIHASAEATERYSDELFDKAMQQCQYGNIIKCPNLYCKEHFEISSTDATCPGCKMYVCHKCKNLKSRCTCPLPIIPIGSDMNMKFCSICRIGHQIPNDAPRWTCYYCCI